ncbi:hypothetical protein ACFWEV_35175 [Streptomyces bacillaris]|uniref:hypothetical protein n=1 Tax=Streptomyces bacillaris TaxID=68179 RepID=UPI00364E0C89
MTDISSPPMVVTLGSVTVGLSILTVILIRWWTRDGHRVKALMPYLGSTLYGMLLILTGGGLLGGAAGWALWGTTETGDVALEHGTGSASPEVTRQYADALTPGGNMVVILCTVALVALLVWGRRPWLHIVLGLLTGISLGLADSLAGFAATALAPAANGIGDALGGLL